MAENEVIELDFDEILTLIQGQLYEYMNAPENNGKYSFKQRQPDGSMYEESGQSIFIRCFNGKMI